MSVDGAASGKHTGCTAPAGCSANLDQPRVASSQSLPTWYAHPLTYARSHWRPASVRCMLSSGRTAEDLSRLPMRVEAPGHTADSASRLRGSREQCTCCGIVCSCAAESAST